MPDLLLRGGRPWGVNAPADVLIRDGVIKRIGPDFPVPPIARLRAAGVTIACGHDGIRDLWSPFGSGDMLERAMHLAYRSRAYQRPLTRGSARRSPVPQRERQ
jgi:cytosine/adenosine deaminase-related metal-dependent hydrolase